MKALQQSLLTVGKSANFKQFNKRRVLKAAVVSIY